MQELAPARLERATDGLEIYHSVERKELFSKQLTPNGETALVPTLYQGTALVPFPPDLQTIAGRWPTLPEATRQALLRLASPELPEHLRLAVLALLDANANR